MPKLYQFCVPVFLACSAAAQAADNMILLTTEHTDYSGAFGKRQETTAESTTDLGSTAFTISAAHAKRQFDDESFSAVRLSGTIYHDWNERFYTRTSLAVSSNKPVFATRELANDFNFKLFPNAVLTVGAKHARYFGGRDALSWSAGGSLYFRGGLMTYRYSSYNVDKLGKSDGHQVTFRLKDGKRDGQTQLWLGAGTSLHEKELLITSRQGKYRSIALQRVQPIRGPISVNLTLGRTWYDTEVDYRGTTGSIGLVYKGFGPF